MFVCLYGDRNLINFGFSRLFDNEFYVILYFILLICLLLRLGFLYRIGRRRGYPRLSVGYLCLLSCLRFKRFIRNFVILVITCLVVKILSIHPCCYRNLRFSSMRGLIYNIFCRFKRFILFILVFAFWDLIMIIVWYRGLKLLIFTNNLQLILSFSCQDPSFYHSFVTQDHHPSIKLKIIHFSIFIIDLLRNFQFISKFNQLQTWTFNNFANFWIKSHKNDKSF